MGYTNGVTPTELLGTRSDAGSTIYDKACDFVGDSPLCHELGFHPSQIFSCMSLNSTPKITVFKELLLSKNGR